MDDDLIGWKQSFMTYISLELVIEGFTNLLQKMKLRIQQGSPIYPIRFRIYISGVFSIIEKQFHHVTYMSFINDFDILAANRSINKIAKTFEKVRWIPIE